MNKYYWTVHTKSDLCEKFRFIILSVEWEVNFLSGNQFIYALEIEQVKRNRQPLPWSRLGSERFWGNIQNQARHIRYFCNFLIRRTQVVQTLFAYKIILLTSVACKCSVLLQQGLIYPNTNIDNSSLITSTFTKFYYVIPERKTVFVIIIYREKPGLNFILVPSPLLIIVFQECLLRQIFHLWVFNAVTNKYITWDGEVKQSFHFYMFKEHVE